MEDYSKFGEETERLLNEAKLLFDSGKFNEAKFVYIDADGENSADECISIDATLGNLKCEVYSNVQSQYFPSEEGRNHVAYIREAFEIERKYIDDVENSSKSNFDYFNADEARIELKKIENFYENSYKVFLERNKNNKTINGGCLSALICCFIIVMITIVCWNLLL
jgi:hypothetical protein